MKNLIFIFAFALISNVFAQEEAVSNLNWLTDIEQAKSISSKEKKPILVYFTGSDWCSPCKMLKEDFFNTSKFEEKAKSMVLLMVDIPRRIDIISAEQKVKNEALVKKYNKKGGYPNLVALNEKGKIIGELSGYTFLRETDRHYAFIDSVLENY
ncbi:thioredoxin family protein [Lacinutrix sp. C3R15]|uniref:thioredoxin family protein n=1 Tax=Flavobacteriaceae TaxID=49546 RepID=UPI001C0911EE|nr:MULTISPECIES: thioredoxin family protein [Flavobacteriaceae]MBU2940551.1 thioredoxin family protein [Lacinutrix sp. C3R15]MDO6623871.1 thioredoxin family protein [Oceanihabitans sp. 1_MG-2023]